MPPSSQTTAAGDTADAASLALAAHVSENLRALQGKLPRHATKHDWYVALAHTIRARLLDRSLTTVEAVLEGAAGTKLVAYLSAEFLPGPHLGNALLCLDAWDTAKRALNGLGLELDDVLDEEEEPGLGNGGLGRLAACFMDSLATLGVPAIGYGIRYEFGIFDQAFENGWQVERTDKWLRFGNPWEIVRNDVCFDVGFGGRTEHYRDGDGFDRVRWLPGEMVRGIAYDTPVPGYQRPTANLLRLWKAEAVESFDLDAFNAGDYYTAVEKKVISETISKILYPNDEPEAGKRLRLAQQYFFVSCSLQDMIRLHALRGKPLSRLDAGWAAQLNDTHPSLAIAELMRLLVDVSRMDWDDAWAITQRTCAYTNHTLLAEALERWPVPLLGSLLPRHLEIIYEINRRFLDEVRLWHPGEPGLDRRLSLIDEHGARSVRMAHLACVGSHAINGVAAMHSQLLTTTVLADFHRIIPDRFHNVTNGVTPRRWLLLANPALSRLITSRIGDGWAADLEHALPRLEPIANDPDFCREWRQVKAANKQALATVIKDRTGVVVDPESLYDVQVKRLHEYKRQHLNVLHLISLYLAIQSGATITPRTVIFGGKAAPGYRMAKLIIKLINSVAAAINADARTAGLLRVVYLPDFNVKNGMRVYAAADLSEQISTAGKEASGTGNMKFSMNGALTIGTLDGANVEIRDAVGADNFFLFGLTAPEVEAQRRKGYAPGRVYDANPHLRAAIDLIADGAFSGGDRALFRPLLDSLMTRDDYMVFADYQSYIDCQRRVDLAYSDPGAWTRCSILNASRVGRFSSDRSIREYCRNIWGITVKAGHTR